MNAGTVRTAIMMIRPIKAMGFGARLDEERNASGIEMTAPTTVPRNAMHTVSRSR